MDAEILEQINILNFFLVKNDWASTAEMNRDFEQSGTRKAGKQFEVVLNNGWLDKDRKDGLFIYRINDSGKFALEKYKNDLKSEGEPLNVAYKQLGNQKLNTILVGICAILAAAALIEGCLLAKCK